MPARVLAVCISERKGTRKTPMPEGGVFIEDFGLERDAHSERGIKRQVSLLAVEDIEKMRRETGLDLHYGDFAENLTTEGIEVAALPIGTPLAIGSEVVLKVSQIGKDCHVGCEISRLTGKCIMPKRGVFATVVRGGRISPGDLLEIIAETNVSD